MKISTPPKEFFRYESGAVHDEFFKIPLRFHNGLASRGRPQNLVFSDISLMAILAWVIPSESDKVRHSTLGSENLTNNQS